MELCQYAQEEIDGTGCIDYYCSKLDWRMGIEGFFRCRQCSYYQTGADE